MKAKHLAICLALFMTAVMISCKKEDKPTDPEPVLSSKDPKAISAAVKVWHGERKQGNAPAPAGTALQLDASASAPITYAFAGRFAIMQPEILQGDVEGYYLQVNGANEYFKIDYSKPRGARLRSGTKPSNPFRSDSRQQRTQNGNSDSAIVIALPANLQVPDTFCISYCAYDVQGNISNVVTTCIVVSSLGTDVTGSWVHGEWKHTASWDTNFVERDTVIYNQWRPYSHTYGYSCHYDSVSGSNILGFTNVPADIVVNDSMFTTKSHLVFGTNGGMAYEYKEKTKILDFSVSSCSQFTFHSVYETTDHFNGAWNYNPATGKMVLVFEFDDNGNAALEAWEYRVVKLSNSHMVLVDESYGPGYVFNIRFEK